MIESIHDYSLKGYIHDDQDVQSHSSISFPAYIFPRINKSFRVTENLSKPLILISAGTGIAPFLTYLEYRQKEFDKLKNVDDIQFAKLFFIFGCRHPVEDFAYRTQIINYSKGNFPVISHLCLCFSRCSNADISAFETEIDTQLCTTSNDQDDIKHVDQLVILHGEQLVDLISNCGASIYVCGDWKKVSTSVSKAFVEIFSKYHFDHESVDSAPQEALKYIKKLQSDGRYLQDIWT